MHRESALREAGDAGEDLVGGLGPDEGFGGVVMRGNELADGGFELGDAAVHPTTELLGRQRRKGPRVSRFPWIDQHQVLDCIIQLRPEHEPSVV